jgi:hypothetical protein
MPAYDISRVSVPLQASCRSSLLPTCKQTDLLNKALLFIRWSRLRSHDLPLNDIKIADVVPGLPNCESGQGASGSINADLGPYVSRLYR